MSLAIPVSGSFATPTHTLLPKPRPASAKSVPGSASPFSTCCQGPRTLQVGKASSPGLRQAHGDSCSSGRWAPTPRLSLGLLASTLLHSRSPASSALTAGWAELSAGQLVVLAYRFAHSLHAASTPGTTWSGAPGQEALGDLLV